MPTWEQRSKFVIQAAGMVSVQAGCTLDEAVELMNDRAIVDGISREEVAGAVIRREMRFGP
jgi:hypothetical protein